MNKQVGRIRRVFRWAASRELVPAVVAAALRTVDGLQRGRSEAVERPPVGPAPDADVAAVLPYLQPTIRAMVELQRLTGMRPGEVRLLRGADLDRSGPVWRYTPPGHKMAHAGRVRVVLLGPRA